MDTKCGYVSSLRHLWKFAYFNDVDITDLPVDPLFWQFWIAERAGDDGNIKSLRTWTATIAWLYELAKAQPTYQNDRGYRLFIQQIQRQCGERRTKRLPFQIQHLINYAKAMGVVQGNYMKCEFDALLKVTAAVVTEFTMSRPSELFKSSSDYNDGGIMMKHLTVMFQQYKQQGRMYWKIKVRKFKNQKFRRTPKIIPIASANHDCKDKDCACHGLNPLKLLRAYLLRRHKRYQKLSAQKRHSEAQPFANEPDNPFFIKENGKEFTTTNLGKVAKEIAAVNELAETSRYTAYSFRIGGTTVASYQRIDKAQILQYVQWSENRLPDASHHYTQFDQERLAITARMMLHGNTRFSWSRSNKNINKVYNPWAMSWMIQSRARR